MASSPSVEDISESANTIRATKGSEAMFKDYLAEKGLNFPETSEELAVILQKFYSEVRKKDGSKYSRNSLCALRFGLNRYFKTLRNIDIIRDKEFNAANKSYGAECNVLDKTEHKPPISDEDIKKLYECGLFNIDTPSTLQNKVFFELMLYFCHRGRQNLRHLRKNDFDVKVNQQGQKYVVKVSDATNTTNLGDCEEGGIMVESNTPLCPVYSFEKYLSHLNPLNNFLFQRPRGYCHPDSIVWYDNVVIGENTLGRKMRVLSIQANLSAEYTNHSIRATTISILNRRGYLAKHIMCVSGHKNENSIAKLFNRAAGQTTKTEMADCLNSVIQNTQELLESAKKRKLDHEFSKESKTCHISPVPITPKVTVPVNKHSIENIAPEKESSPSPISRRKAPRSHVRKVVRTHSQDKIQEDANITQSVLKSEVTPQESLQNPQRPEKKTENPNDSSTTATLGVLTSSENEKNENSVQIVRECRVESVNVANETTVIEEDYQRKYFQLLNTMNDLQEKFLTSQRSFEELVKVREAFIEELKSKLENNHQEISSIKQELETSNDKISELEEKRNMYENKILNLSEKVEAMKVKEVEVEHRLHKDREDELQRNIEKQQEVLEFYKLLTSVTVEKVTENENENSPNVYDKFRCCVKTAQEQELQFLLSYDSEFAEVEYAPLALDSVDSSFPEYLREQIFFESSQAPYFLQRLIQTFQKPGDK